MGGLGLRSSVNDGTSPSSAASPRRVVNVIIVAND